MRGVGDLSVNRSKDLWAFRWWFFPVMLLLFFLPPIAQRGFAPERWQELIVTTLGGGAIYRMVPVTPYVHAAFLVVLVLALANPGRFMRYFSAYAAVSYFVFAVVQSVAWSKTFGYSVVTSNFVWFSLVGAMWGSEALSKPNPERRLRFHGWHLWVIPLCVFAFWAPPEPWDFHPKYLVWNISVLAFCLMTPIYLAVHASFFPLANTALLRVTGCAGVIIGIVNMMNSLFRNSPYNAAVHVPLLLVSAFALVLARRQRRLQRALEATVLEEDGSGSNASVSVRGLLKRYGSKVAVKEVSFEVAPGELFGLLGPNGAGKTTTVECIAGLRRPDAGTLRVCGLDPTRDVLALRHSLGIQLQKTGLPEGLKVGEAARYFSAFFGGSVDPDGLLETLDLAPCTNTLYGKLSGGQKQRLHFLIALLGDPQVLIVDEPTTGLDPVARQAVWRLLRERTARGKSVILTTHFMQEAHALCDRLAFLQGGEIIAEGSPEELVRSLGWSVHIRLRLDRPCSSDILRSVPGVGTVVQEDPWMVIRGKEGLALNDVFDTVAKAGCVVREVKTQEATLDDVFIALAGVNGGEPLPTREAAVPAITEACCEQKGMMK